MSSDEDPERRNAETTLETTGPEAPAQPNSKTEKANRPTGPAFSRRGVLKISALAATVSFGGYVGYHWLFGKPTNIVVAILRRRLGHLKLPTDDSLRAFAAEFVTEKAATDSLTKASALALPLRVFSPYEWLEIRHSLRRLEDGVVSKFLLSTDFFLYGADEQREVRYLSYYSPYTAPCRNPFARPLEAGGG